MKKNILKTILFIVMILLIISCYVIISNANSITYYTGKSINISNQDQIEVLSAEVKIDTINSLVGTTTIIRNTSNKSRDETISIPVKDSIVETKIKTLKILVNGVEVKYQKTDDEKYTFNVKMKPNEAKKIIVVYQTENDLKKARVLKYDFEDLGIGNRTIKKAKVDIVLQEKDIPLVTKVYPGHYTLENNTISVEYYNFKVNSLTKEVMIEKETYDNLLYGRDIALTDIDKKVLSLVPEWEKNGLAINYATDIIKRTDDYKYFDLDSVIKRVTGIKVEMDKYGTENISQNSKAIVTYYVVKELAKDKNNKYVYTVLESTKYDNFYGRHSLLKDVILKNCTQNENLTLLGKTVCIDYVFTKNGEDLYVDKTTDSSNECNIVKELTKKDEFTIITAEVYSFAKVPETGAKIIFLGKDIQATDEEKVEYVNMINADMYIRTMLYDKEYQKSSLEGLDEGHDGYVGYNSKENLQIAKSFVNNDFIKYANYTETQYYNEVLKENTTDYALLHSEIPCVIQYIGYIKEKEGKKVVNYFWDGFYDYFDRGLATTDEVLKTSRAKELLSKNRAKNEKTKQDIETELNNLKIEKDDEEQVKEEVLNTTSQTEEISKNKNFIEIIKENLNTIIFISMGIIVFLIILCIIVLIVRRKR